MKAFMVTRFGVNEFEVENKEKLARITYFSQEAIRVALTISIADSTENLISNFSFKDWFTKDTSFRVTCDNLTDKIPSPDIEREIGAQVVEAIEKELGFKPKVSLKDPDITIYCYINNKVWLGVDFAGRDLGKRHYKIYSLPTAYKGDIGFGLLKFAGYEPGKKLLDPFSGCGIITIEAGLFMSEFSVNHFDKLAYQKFLDVKFDDKPKPVNSIYNLDPVNKHIKFAKNNAKIAGVEGIEFSKCELDYLDTKFDEGEFDFIVTQIHQASKHFPEKRSEKLNDEFFYQANYVLKKDGTIAIIAQRKDNILKAAKKHKFKLIDEKTVPGGVIYYMMKFAKA